MRRNTLRHRVVYRNPEDRSEAVRVAPGATYDDDQDWVAAAADATDGQDEVTDLSDLTVAQLRDLLTERGVEVPSGAKKDDLLALT